jgi:hypothetical protein
MGRPEKPITGDSRAADLARTLRELRARAGSPAYAVMARAVRASGSALAAAASGDRCPTWSITQAYAEACEADPDSVQPLWSAADQAGRRERTVARKRRGLAPVSRLPSSTATPPGGQRGGTRTARRPSPWDAATPAEYVYQLRKLRAWGGNPGLPEVTQAWRRRTGRPGRLASSSFYDTLSPDRPSLPALLVVQALVEACGADVDEWTEAWRAVNLSEFERAHPNPLTGVPPAEGGVARDRGQGGTVHRLERPAR